MDYVVGRYGRQDAAHLAYLRSGVFGPLRHIGFVPNVARTDEVIIDAASMYPNALQALHHAFETTPPGTQISIFVPYNDTVFADRPEPPDGYSYTLYDTVHPSNDALRARLNWYVATHQERWAQYGQRVLLYASYNVQTALQQHHGAVPFVWVTPTLSTLKRTRTSSQ